MDTSKMMSNTVMGVFRHALCRPGDKEYPFVRVTKLENNKDAKYAAEHARNIKVGSTYEGKMLRPVAVGESFYVDFPDSKNHFHTSVVKEILSENTFRTMNSVYKWEIIS